MHDDYLWDPAASQDADPTIVALERTLAPLRYEDEPLRLPLQEPVVRPRPWRWALPLCAAAAAVALALALTPKESASVVVTVLPEVPTPEPSAVEVAARPIEAPESVKPAPAPPPVPVVKPPPAKRQRPAKPPRPKPEPKPEPDASGPKVDCILDSSKCRRVDPNLPATLTSTQIREGVAAVKDEAKACGPRHGATAGTKVKVKFAVSGQTGRVIDAVAQPPWVGTPLGECVAAALAEAQFPTFQKERLAAVYPIVVDGS